MLTEKTLQEQPTTSQFRAYLTAHNLVDGADNLLNKTTPIRVQPQVHTAGDVFKLASAEFLGQGLEGLSAGLIPDSVTEVAWQPRTAKEKLIKTLSGIAGNILGTIGGFALTGGILDALGVPALISKGIRAEKLAETLGNLSEGSKIGKILIGDAPKLVDSGIRNALTFGTYRGISDIQSDKPFKDKLGDVVESSLFGVPFARVGQIDKWYKGLPASFSLFATDSLLRDLRVPPAKRGNITRNAIVNGLVGAGLDTLGRIRYQGKVEPTKSIEEMNRENYQRAKEIVSEPQEVKDSRIKEAIKYDNTGDQPTIEVKPVQPEEAKPVETKIPKGLEGRFEIPERIITRKNPASISKTNLKFIVGGHPNVFTDSFILLEDRTPVEVKKWTEKLSKERNVDYSVVRELYPKEKTEPVRLIAFERRKPGLNIAHLDIGREESEVINAEYYQWLKKQGYTIKSTGKSLKPLVLERNGKDVGLLMPMQGFSRLLKQEEVKGGFEYNQATKPPVEPKIDINKLESSIEKQTPEFSEKDVKRIGTALRRVNGFIPDEDKIVARISSGNEAPLDILNKVDTAPGISAENVGSLGKLLPAIQDQSKKTIDQLERIRTTGNAEYDKSIKTIEAQLEKEKLPDVIDSLKKALDVYTDLKEELNSKIDKEIARFQSIIDYTPTARKMNKDALNDVLNNKWLATQDRSLDDLYAILAGQDKFDMTRERQIKRLADKRAKVLGFEDTKDLYNKIRNVYPEFLGISDAHEVAKNVVGDTEAKEIEDELEQMPYRLPILNTKTASEQIAEAKNNPEKIDEVVKKHHIYFEVQKMINKLGVSTKMGRLDNPLALAKTEDGAIKAMGVLRNEVIPHEVFHIKDTLGAEKMLNDFIANSPEKANTILTEMSQEMGNRIPNFDKLPLGEKLAYTLETWFNTESQTFNRLMPRTNAFLQKVLADIKEADPLTYQTIIDTRAWNLAFKEAPAVLKADASIVSRDVSGERQKYLLGLKDKPLLQRIIQNTLDRAKEQVNIFKFGDKLEEVAHTRDGKYMDPTTGKYNKELVYKDKLPVSEFARMVPNLTNSLSLFLYEKGIPNPGFYKSFFEGSGDFANYIKRGGEKTGFTGILQRLFGLDNYEIGDNAYLHKGGIKDILAPVYEKGLEHDLKVYLAALEYEKRYRIAEENKEGIPPAPPGFGKEEVPEVLKAKKQKMESEGIDVDKVVSDLSDYRKSLLNFAKETNALPSGLVKKLLKEEFHFPLLRARGLGMPEARVSLFNKWLGSEAPILDPIESYLNEIEYIGRKTVENKLLNQLADTIGNKKIVFGKEFAEVLDRPLTPEEANLVSGETEGVSTKQLLDDRINEILGKLINLNPDIEENELQRIKYDLKKYPSFVNQLWNDIKFGIKNNDMFPVRRPDGTVQYVRLSKNLADSMNLLREQNLNDGLTRFLQGYTSLKRSFLTTYSLPFAVTNIFRDQITQWVLANKANIPMVGTLKGLSKALSESDAHKQLADLFGLEWNTFSKLARLDSLSGEGKIGNGIGGVLKKAAKALETMSSTSELSSRLGVFSNYDPTNLAEVRRGLVDARDATYFWGQRGARTAMATKYNRMSAFFRAGIDASYQAFGTAGKYPVRTLIRTSPIIGLAALEIMLHHNDKDWQQLPLWRHFISINLGKVGKHWLFIPMNEIYYSAPHAISIALYKWASGQSPLEANKFLLDLANTASPFGVTNALPDIGKAALEIFAPNAFNTDLFTGREIVPDWMKEFPAREQYTNYTSDTIVGLAHILDKISPKWAPVSPIRLQHFLDTNFGAMGKYFESAGDLMIDSVGKRIGINPNKIREGDAFKDLNTLSGLNRFIHDEYSPTTEADVMKFMDTYRRLRGTQRTIESYKNYHPKQYVEMATRYANEYNAYNVLNPYYKAIRNLTKAYRAVENNKNITDKERDEILGRIKESTRRYAEYANDVYSTYLKDRDVKASSVQY